MPICTPIRRKKRQPCLGDMDTLITIEDRNIEAPEFGTVDFDETFSAPNPPEWALVQTVNGETFFDGVNTEENITHHIYINFDTTVTAESWIKLEDGSRLDILQVENLEERSEFMLLYCTMRGAVEASKA